MNIKIIWQSKGRNKVVGTYPTADQALCEMKLFNKLSSADGRFIVRVWR